MIRALAVLFAAGSLASAAIASVECRDETYAGNRYAICEIDAASDDLRLFLYNDAGRPLGQFTSVDRALGEEGKTLGFAMNAGMYHSDRAPVGHYVENGTEVQRVIPNAGPGNFGLLPNGVFCIGGARADVIETLEFIRRAPACRFATQSGPMLVIGGELHPRFLADSTSRYIRNGVGTGPGGQRAVFAISRNPVTFHEFGSLFRDHLGLPNALYFDGSISRLYAPGLDRRDAGFPMGPIVGVAVPRTQ